MFPWELRLDSCIISCGWRTHRECRGQVFLPGGYHDRVPCEQIINAVGSGGYSALPAHPFTWAAIKTASPCPGWCTTPSFPNLVAIIPRGCLCSCEGGYLCAAGTTQALSSVLARATRCWGFLDAGAPCTLWLLTTLQNAPALELITDEINLTKNKFLKVL